MLLFLISSARSGAQSYFSEALQQIARNYPGYVIGQRDSQFKKLAYRTLALERCDTFIALSKILDQFSDPHLCIVELDCKSGIGKREEVSRLIPEGNSRNEYVIEGFYSNEYKNTVIRLENKPGGHLIGLVDRSLQLDFQPGTCILDCQKESSTTYYGSYVDEFSKKRRGGRIHFRSPDEFITGSYGKWFRIKEYKDFSFDPAPLDVVIDTTNEDTTVISLPCSSSDCKLRLDSLLQIHGQAISRRSRLVIDMRKNVGGQSAIIESLLPYIYTQPIFKPSVSLYVSPLLIQETVQELSALRAKGDSDKELVNEYSKWLVELRSSKGKFISQPQDTFSYSSILKKPSKVDVIIDYSNQSAAEIMILMLRQSGKVTLWGERTHGAIDFLSYRPVPLIPGKLMLYIPSTRRDVGTNSTLLDNVGIHPDKCILKVNEHFPFLD